MVDAVVADVDFSQVFVPFQGVTQCQRPLAGESVP